MHLLYRTNIILDILMGSFEERGTRKKITFQIENVLSIVRFELKIICLVNMFNRYLKLVAKMHCINSVHCRVFQSYTIFFVQTALKYLQ